jgi:hypothetical protein
LIGVMAGCAKQASLDVPAIHVLATEKKGVDAQVKPGHDGV